MPSGIYIRTEKTRKILSNGRKGMKFTEEHKQNMRGRIGKLSATWKGDLTKYSGKHEWIRRHYGKPEFCEACGAENSKKFEWANISGKHRRDKEDYLRLCAKCHDAFDKPWLKRTDGYFQKGNKFTREHIENIIKVKTGMKYNKERIAI